MDERAIFAIKEYMFDFSELGENWSRFDFRLRSYARWAVSEIIKNIETQCNRSSIEIVEDFAKKMNQYSELSYDDRSGRQLFRVAYTVATDILDILRAMN